MNSRNSRVSNDRDVARNLRPARRSSVRCPELVIEVEQLFITDHRFQRSTFPGCRRRRTFRVCLGSGHRVVDTAVRSARGQRRNASNSAMRCLSFMFLINSGGGGSALPEATAGVGVPMNSRFIRLLR
eukprot:2295331-Heterocapsa_arctica.AAC.2